MWVLNSQGILPAHKPMWQMEAFTKAKEIWVDSFYYWIPSIHTSLYLLTSRHILTLDLIIWLLFTKERKINLVTHSWLHPLAVLFFPWEQVPVSLQTGKTIIQWNTGMQSQLKNPRLVNSCLPMNAPSQPTASQANKGLLVYNMEVLLVTNIRDNRDQSKCF